MRYPKYAGMPVPNQTEAGMPVLPGDKTANLQPPFF